MTFTAFQNEKIHFKLVYYVCKDFNAVVYI